MSTLSREQQRVIGVLKLSTANSLDAGESTLIDTIHAAADTIEWLLIEGGDQFKDYSPKERRRMAQEGRAMPDGSYPIATCDDAEKAIRAQGRAKDQKKVVVHIRKRVRALRCSGDIFNPYK